MLAIFDLDETLIRGDSSQLFTHFLRAHNIDTTPDAELKDQAFMAAYHAGQLDLQSYMEFSLAPIKGWSREALSKLVNQFVAEVISPRTLPTGIERVQWHKQQGHEVVIISATGEHLVGPIAKHLSIDEGIGVQIEWLGDSLKGTIGTRRPFRDGKVTALREWLRDRATRPEKTWFYSDSHNDLPLLNTVDFPVALNPDPILRDHAERQGWKIYDDTAEKS